MADGKTCGKYIGVGDYPGDLDFCYFKKSYGSTCNYYA